mmetsp:Transcript_16689/g.34285  ORF Transcript_16689/g.34285 Transcript_16689/m.34285 type:complete len:401 (+) Transcript_16689:637-1839(+)
MEYVNGCELFEYLVKRGRLEPKDALEFFQQIINGLEYCHKRLICHRDLKPENILLDQKFNVKIADFGMTSLNPPGSLLETSCGSPHYAAPEVVSGDLYNGLEADIWSCGVILYAMLTGRLPFDDENIHRLLAKVQRGVYHLPSDMNAECKSLVRAMLTVDPSKRISIEGIKRHSWFQSGSSTTPHVDDFSEPIDPILNPNPEVLKGLVTLGWGSAEQLTETLSKTEPNLEKVFYIQLSRHLSFKPKGVGGSSAEGTNGWLPDEWKSKKNERNPRGGVEVDAAKSSGETSVNNETVAQVTDAMESLSAAPSACEEGEGGDGGAETVNIGGTAVPAHVAQMLSAMADGASRVSIPQSKSQLIRQTQLARRAKADHIDETALHNVSGDEKSWFGSLRTVFRNH